jgi:hypothetical protein
MMILSWKEIDMGDQRSTESTEENLVRCACGALRRPGASWEEKPVIEINLPILQRGRHSREHCEPRPTAARIC